MWKTNSGIAGGEQITYGSVNGATRVPDNRPSAEMRGGFFVELQR